VFIPKADGRRRPLGVAALEDKILQRAVAEVLNAIYEADFLGFSYGFRPGRSPHHALDALSGRGRTRHAMDNDRAHDGDRHRAAHARRDQEGALAPPHRDLAALPEDEDAVLHVLPGGGYLPGDLI